MEPVLNTLILMVGAASLAVALGLPLGVLLGGTDLPGRGAWRTLLSVPYLVPGYVGAIAWIALANPRSGLINRLLGAELLDIYGLPGMVWVEGVALSPLVTSAVADALGRLDPTLLEAARIAGAGKGQALVKVVFPLLRPALLAAGGLVLASTGAAFGVPYLLAMGDPDPDVVLTTKIVQALELSPVDGMGEAARLGLPLLVLGLGLPALLRLVGAGAATVGGKAARPFEMELGSWRGPALGLVAGWAVLSVLLPFATLIWSAGGAFSRVAEAPDNWRAAANSTLAAGGAALLAVGVGAGVAWIRERSALVGRGALAALVALPFSVPGTVLGLAVLLATTRELRVIVLDQLTLTLALRGTLWVLALAWALRFAAIPLGRLRAALGGLHPVLEESARVAGASPGRAAWSITGPLLRPDLVAAFILVFLPAFSEVTMAILLYGPETEVLGTRLFELQSYGDPEGAAALSVVLAGVVLAANLGLRRVSGGRVGL